MQFRAYADFREWSPGWSGGMAIRSGCEARSYLGDGIATR